MGKYFVRGLAHIGIPCKYPQAAAQFYIDNLDFHPYHNVPFGDTGSGIYFVENYGMILEFIPNADPAAVDGHVDHICLDVQGIDELVAELKAKGIEMEGEVGSLSLFPHGVKNVFFRGPAGERIELFDYTK